MKEEISKKKKIFMRHYGCSWFSTAENPLIYLDIGKYLQIILNQHFCKISGDSRLM